MNIQLINIVIEFMFYNALSLSNAFSLLYKHTAVFLFQ